MNNEKIQSEADLCFRSATAFHSLGFNVVPRNPEKKIPAVYWRELQSRRVTKVELIGWRLKFAGGVGFITGAISNAIVIESDGPEGEALIAKFEETHGALPKTLTVRSGSGRGLHRYFRHPGYRVTTRANTLIKLDVKGDGGFCILPPSLHHSGERYKFVVRESPAQLPGALLDFIEIEAAKAKGLGSNVGPLRDAPLPLGDDLLGENTKRFEPLPVNPVNVAIIITMLDALPDYYVVDHDEWLRVGLALHSFDNGKVGLALWKRFSQRCPDKACKTDFDARWNSFGREYSGAKISIGTLWMTAALQGWCPPRKWDRSTKIDY